MENVWNFSAGPAKLPQSVLQKAKEELISYGESGMSVMEMSHRSEDFTTILEETEESLRNLLNISQDYSLLFLQGGASQQFAMIPMNLRETGQAAYINTGSWSEKAQNEAARTGMDVDIIASSVNQNHTIIPKISSETHVFAPYDYVHITSNNTIEGTQFHSFPDTGETPLVADMSSDILSRPFDINQFGLVYAGAQKNLGIAGLTLVIIRNDLLDKNPELPKIFNYQTHVTKGSTYNTPPTFAIYMSGLVFKWIEQLGGLEKIANLNKEKADRLYRYIDQSQLFKTLVPEKHRSFMNVPFVTDNEKWDTEFIELCTRNKIKNIKGHRSTGGMRASIYNAMPIEGIDALIDTMQEFEEQKGAI